MKKIFLLIALISGFAASAKADMVRGYVRKDGTYVQPYQRTHPDGNPYNNYSYHGD